MSLVSSIALLKIYTLVLVPWGVIYFQNDEISEMTFLSSLVVSEGWHSVPYGVHILNELTSVVLLIFIAPSSVITSLFLSSLASIYMFTVFLLGFNRVKTILYGLIF